MQKLIFTTTAILFIWLSSWAQETSYGDSWKLSNSAKNTPKLPELSFAVRGNYSYPITKDKLTSAKFLKDFIAYYPENWFTHYLSVEISVTSGKKTLSSISPNDVLNIEQKQLLQTVEFGTEIEIVVNYRSENPVTGVMEKNKMNVLMTVVPDVEAEYIGGRNQWKKYFQEKAINLLTDAEVKPGKLRFTINETGEVVNIFVEQSTGNQEIDKFLLEIVSKMPEWKPAQNSMGQKVKQDFVFLIERGGC